MKVSSATIANSFDPFRIVRAERRERLTANWQRVGAAMFLFNKSRPSRTALLIAPQTAIDAKIAADCKLLSITGGEPCNTHSVEAGRSSLGPTCSLVVALLRLVVAAVSGKNHFAIAQSQAQHILGHQIAGYPISQKMHSGIGIRHPTHTRSTGSANYRPAAPEATKPLHSLTITNGASNEKRICRPRDDDKTKQRGDHRRRFCRDQVR
jgi:hypothetical protein